MCIRDRACSASFFLPGQKPGKKKLAEQAVHALGFTLDELKEARLAPLVDFKGRKPRDAAAPGEQVGKIS